MVEIKLSVANADIPVVRGWIADMKLGLAEDMCAPVPTPRSNRATLVFALLDRLSARLTEHTLHVAELEAAAKAARKMTRTATQEVKP